MHLWWMESCANRYLPLPVGRVVMSRMDRGNGIRHVFGAPQILGFMDNRFGRSSSKRRVERLSQCSHTRGSYSALQRRLRLAFNV